MSSSEDISYFTALATKYKVLSHEEERNLVKRAQDDPKDHAWDILIKHNIRLVISIAKRYLNKGLSFEDLVQEGTLGLMEGITKFDLDRTYNGKHLKLSTYATNWIKQRITRAIANTSRLIRIPVHILNEYPLVQRLYGKFREQWGKYPNADELEVLYNKAVELDVKKKLKPKTKEEIAELGRFFRPTTSLDEINSEDENLTILDYCTSNEEQPDNILQNNETKMYVKGLIEKLGPEDKIFISILFGLVDGKQKNRKAMSQIRKMTEKELEQKELEILNKLREFIKEDQNSNKFKANLSNLEDLDFQEN